MTSVEWYMTPQEFDNIVSEVFLSYWSDQNSSDDKCHPEDLEASLSMIARVVALTIPIVCNRPVVQ